MVRGAHPTELIIVTVGYCPYLAIPVRVFYLTPINTLARDRINEVSLINQRPVFHLGCYLARASSKIA